MTLNKTFIHQAVDTVDPFAFSAENFKRMKAWQVQETECSWFYARRATVPKKDMIAALEADLQALRDAPEIPEDQFEDNLLDCLQDYLPENQEEAAYWREGDCTYPRRDDGTVDVDALKEHFPECAP